MKHNLKSVLILGILPFMLVTTSCSPSNATNYDDINNWLIKRSSSNTNYDLIYFIGTSVNEPKHDNGTGDICSEMRATGLTNFTNVGAQLTFARSTSGKVYRSNVYVPLYRQMALNYAVGTYTKHDELLNDIRTKEPGVDLKAALDYYFTNHNKDAQKPYVIAGHSQGAASLQVMFEEYFIKGGHKSYLKNCVAMYSTGYGVSKKWFNGLDRTLDGRELIHLATRATDTNCMLCWNTEGPDNGDGDFLLSDEKNDTYCINPLNWKTDATYASRSENLGVLIKNPDYDPNDPTSPMRIISTEEDKKFDACINLERGTVVSTKPNSGSYMFIPPYGYIWGGKSLHLSDGPGFYINMSRNLGDRLEAWFKK